VTPAVSSNVFVEKWILGYFKASGPTKKFWFEIIEEITEVARIPDGAVTAVFLNLIERGEIIRLRDEWRTA